MLSVTMVVENVFCPKFTYYGLVLGLEQYEQKRGTVSAGKIHHKTAESTNKSFVPKHMVGRKITSQKMYSQQHGFVGIVDHAIEMKDEIVLIERKYVNHSKIYDTIKVQIGLLSILLEENLHKPVRKAQVIFAYGGKRTEVDVNVDQGIRDFAIKMLDETKKIIDVGVSPDAHYDNRCINCCYRKICDVGSLNSS